MPMNFLSLNKQSQTPLHTRTFPAPSYNHENLSAPRFTFHDNKPDRFMKVFISWSGPRSKAVAIVLRDWLRCVIQALDPWLSTDGIDRGAIWFSQIMEELKDTRTGIICLTSENKNVPWILFEAGALAKGLSTNRVCTFLIDLAPADVEDPLAQFNHTTPTEESMFALLRTLNAQLEKKLDDNILQQVFRAYWEQFTQDFNKAVSDTKVDATALPPVEREERSILEEILSTTKAMEKQVVRLDSEVKDLRMKTPFVNLSGFAMPQGVSPTYLEPPKTPISIFGGTPQGGTISVLDATMNNAAKGLGMSPLVGESST